METMWRDIRVGSRVLVRRPAFAATVVLCLGLGIGGVTAVFSVFHGVTARFMPHERSDQLVFLITSGVFDDRTPAMSAQYYLEWKAQNRSFAEMAAYQRHEPHAGPAGWAQTQENLMDLQGLTTTGSLFSVLRIRMQMGRPLDEKDQGQPVIVLSHHIWRERFAADPQILGQSILLGGQARQIVGVTASSCRFLPTLDVVAINKKMDYWVPVGAGFPNEARTSWNYAVLARLKPGVTLAQAQADMDSVTRRQQEQYLDDFPKEAHIVVQPMARQLLGPVRSAIPLALAAAVFVLLIVCANVVNLFLVYAARRKTEMAIRSALGSPRWRLMRQLIGENVILVLLGGALGVLLAWRGVDVLLHLAPRNLPGIEDIRMDIRVLAVALGTTASCALAIWLIPGICASHVNLANVLKESGTRTTSSFGERRTARLVVMSEMILSFVLIVGAGLLIQSHWHLMRVELGIQPHHVLTLRLSGPNLVKRHDELLERLQSLPGVSLAASSTGLPLSGEPSDSRLVRPLPTDRSPDSYPVVYLRTISTEYFRVLGASLIGGRHFARQDNEKSSPVVIVNEALARRLWPEKDPIGQQMTFDAAKGNRVFYNGGGETLVPRQVVGVVRDIRYAGPDQEPPLEAFIPFTQRTRSHYILSVALRCQADPADLMKTVRREAQAVDPSFKVESTGTMDGFYFELTAHRRFLMAMLSVFAAVAFTLAVVGVYGVLAFTTSMRVREVGIRMAFGARPRDVLRLFLQQAAGLVLASVGLGLLGVFVLRKILARQLFGISPLDPITLAGGIMLVVLVSLAACYLPARRAAQIDPMVALRDE